MLIKHLQFCKCCYVDWKRPREPICLYFFPIESAAAAIASSPCWWNTRRKTFFFFHRTKIVKLLPYRGRLEVKVYICHDKTFRQTDLCVVNLSRKIKLEGFIYILPLWLLFLCTHVCRFQPAVADCTLHFTLYVVLLCVWEYTVITGNPSSHLSRKKR